MFSHLIVAKMNNIYKVMMVSPNMKGKLIGTTITALLSTASMVSGTELEPSLVAGVSQGSALEIMLGGRLLYPDNKFSDGQNLLVYTAGIGLYSKSQSLAPEHVDANVILSVGYDVDIGPLGVGPFLGTSVTMFGDKDDKPDYTRAFAGIDLGVDLNDRLQFHIFSSYNVVFSASNDVLAGFSIVVNP